MRIALNKRAALYLMRRIRANGKLDPMRTKRCDLFAPDPYPRSRWTRSAIDLSPFGVPASAMRTFPLDVATNVHGKRIQMASATTTKYMRGLPKGAFVQLGNGVAISSPELLYAEMVFLLTPLEHVLLGYELCGAYARNPDDPVCGPVQLDVAPVTSKERLSSFLSEARWIRGAEESLHLLEYIEDDAWSPPEALIAALLSMPIEDCGYELGSCTLNLRFNTPERLACTTERSSRVPDIMIDGTNTGINYDGTVHLDLDSIVDASMYMQANLGSKHAEQELQGALASVRAKVVDDIRRNRELAAQGLTVFPVIKEGMYSPGGLDAVVLQLVERIENDTGRSCEKTRLALRQPNMVKGRHELLLANMPGAHQNRIGRIGDPHAREASETREIIIGI